MNKKQILRKQLNKLRNKLNVADRLKYSNHICSQLTSHFDLSKFASIALYHPTNNEVDLSPLLEKYTNLYLPVMQTNNIMEFCLYKSHENLKQNNHGIYEPQNTKIIDPGLLELCLVPLVGFNRNGNRLGMGGGYYDKYFELNKFKKKPTTLVGIAYDFQENATIQAEPWDIPLDLIITNKEIIKP